MKLEDLETKLGIANLGEEEKLALVKDIQANLPALKAEQRTLEAKTQANLVVEAIKKIKEGLEARFDELNGIVNVKVRDITSGKDGKDGKNGKNGVDGKDGKDGISITGPKGADGKDGEDGVGVQDAHIDFDGSLIITLTTGKEINVGEVVPMDVAEKIKVIGNGGGTSQSVLDAIAALQAVDASYGTMATQNANNVAITGGNINNVTIGGTTPAAGTFTTLTATGQTSLGGDSSNPAFRVNALSGSTRWLEVNGSTSGNAQLTTWSTGAAVGMTFLTRGASNFSFSTNASAATEQFRVAHTASAVNYVQVTGAATGSNPTISTQGSDTNAGLNVQAKGTGVIRFLTGNGTENFRVNAVSTTVNYIAASVAVAGAAPSFAVQGSDTDIDLTLTPKGAGTVRFGTYTASALLPVAGYITVKDSGGTTRRLLVG